MVCPVKPRVAECPGNRAEDDDQKLGMIGDPLAHKSERDNALADWQCITMAGLPGTRTILNAGITDQSIKLSHPTDHDTWVICLT
jgi:hypothetical protein